MRVNPGPGKLIVIEGLDGAGTTTQAQRLGHWLRPQVANVVITWEPTDGPIGTLIRQVLTHQISVAPRALAALFAADRLDHLYKAEGILAHLQTGDWVVMDRYYLSSFAYQSLALDDDEVPWLYAMHAPCIMPDATLFLDVPVEVCLERIRQNRGEQFDLFEREDLLRAASLKYQAAIHKLSAYDEVIHIIDGTHSPEAVTQSLEAITSTLL